MQFFYLYRHSPVNMVLFSLFFFGVPPAFPKFFLLPRIKKSTETRFHPLHYRNKQVYNRAIVGYSEQRHYPLQDAVVVGVLLLKKGKETLAWQGITR